MFQVMETPKLLYLVSEYAPNGDIFGEYALLLPFPVDTVYSTSVS